MFPLFRNPRLKVRASFLMQTLVSVDCSNVVPVLFFRTRKNPGNLQEKDLTRYCGVLKVPPPPWWTCRLLRTLVSAFFVTDVRHAFVSVHILLEWEISRKSSGKPYFTAVLGVTIQSRTLWWISILFRTPWQPHSESGGTHFFQKMSASALQ